MLAKAHFCSFFLAFFAVMAASTTAHTQNAIAQKAATSCNILGSVLFQKVSDTMLVKAVEVSHIALRFPITIAAKSMAAPSLCFRA
jgi:hypothetical protein